jgi:ribosomal protein S14
MDRTLLLSRRSSSSCSRIDGVIRERTISVRFSRLMNKKTPAESTRRGRRCPQTGGEAAGSNSFVLRLQVSSQRLEGLIPGVLRVLLLQVPERPVGHAACIREIPKPANRGPGEVHLD